jgi:hypothetical protein
MQQQFNFNNDEDDWVDDPIPYQPAGQQSLNAVANDEDDWVDDPVPYKPAGLGTREAEPKSLRDRIVDYVNQPSEAELWKQTPEGEARIKELKGQHKTLINAVNPAWKHIYGAVGATMDKFNKDNGKSWIESYKDNRDEFIQPAKEYAEANPISSKAIGLAGGQFSPLRFSLVKGGDFVRDIGAGVINGATNGIVNAGLETDNFEKLPDNLKTGAIYGGVIGGAMPIAKAGGKLAYNRLGRPLVNKVENIWKDKSNNEYKYEAKERLAEYKNALNEEVNALTENGIKGNDVAGNEIKSSVKNILDKYEKRLADENMYGVKKFTNEAGSFNKDGIISELNNLKTSGLPPAQQKIVDDIMEQVKGSDNIKALNQIKQLTGRGFDRDGTGGLLTENRYKVYDILKNERNNALIENAEKGFKEKVSTAIKKADSLTRRIKSGEHPLNDFEKIAKTDNPIKLAKDLTKKPDLLKKVLRFSDDQQAIKDQFIANLDKKTWNNWGNDVRSLIAGEKAPVIDEIFNVKMNKELKDFLEPRWGDIIKDLLEKNKGTNSVNPELTNKNKKR